MISDQFLDTFNAILKEHYADAGITALWANRGRAIGAPLDALERSAPPITPAVVVTLATLGAFEWLRHRKAEVARAEASGDYAPLLAEFVAWLRALLDSWRRAGA